MPQQMRKPKAIVVASAIEKSDFRTHLDGVSNHLRGKLGKLFGGSDTDSTATIRRPDTATNTTASSGSDSPDTTFTPENRGAPSLSPVTSPSEITSAYPGVGAVNHKTRPSPSRPPAKAERPVKPRDRDDSVLHQIRKFEGGGKLPQLGWKSMATNPELWDESGNTFVYVYIRGSKVKPPPSFRLKSSIVDALGSKTLRDKLYDTREPEGWPKFFPHSQSRIDQNAGGTLPEDTVVSVDRYDMADRGQESDDNEIVHPMGKKKKKKKPASKAPPGIEYELYFEWPGSDTGVHSTLWHVTTRNFFAIMYDASSLVGTTLYDSLKMLLERMLAYPGYLDRSINHVDWITEYLTRHGFDDVRNNPSYAASLLAFSELPQVHWREGYIEAFVHCAGMLRMGLDTVTEWRHVSPVTKMYLMNANLELEERIHRAQVWLHDFDFSEMWPVSSAPPSLARGCCDRFRKWLCKYYENAFLHWPPSNEETWLVRDTVLRLRNDFHGLYDYLVDRDASFDGSDRRPGQRWNIISSSNRHFHADSVELPVTDMLLTFDARNNFPHIPHPYPKVPPSLPAAIPKHYGKSGAFHLKKSHGTFDNPAEARRKALSYAEASNVYVLRDQYVHTDLVTNFIRFEQSDMVDQVDPYEARRGRWILIYGILQVLATISVDHPNLRYNDGAQYHLSPQMKGVLPWSPAHAPPEEEADHTHSHCWVVPSTWRDNIQAAEGPQPYQQEQPQSQPPPQARALPHRHGSTAHRPIMWGQYGDGRVRGDEKALTSPTSERSVGGHRDASPASRSTDHKLKFSRSTSAMNIMSNAKTNGSRSISATGESSTTRKRMEEWVANTKGPLTAPPSVAGDPTAPHRHRRHYHPPSSVAGTTTSSTTNSDTTTTTLRGGASPTLEPFGTFTTIENGPPTPPNKSNPNFHAALTNGLPHLRSSSRLGGGGGGGRKQSITTTSGVSSSNSESWGMESATKEVRIMREVSASRRRGEEGEERKEERMGSGFQPPTDW